MSLENMQVEAEVDAALAKLPTGDRLWHLAASIIPANRGATDPIFALIDLAVLMASYLPPEQRAAVAWKLVSEASHLSARVH